MDATAAEPAVVVTDLTVGYNGMPVVHELSLTAEFGAVTALLGDAIDSGKGDVAEALRPLYLDYLVKHDVRPGGPA